MMQNTNLRNAQKAGDSTFQQSFDYIMNTDQDDEDTYQILGGVTGTPWAIVDDITGTFARITQTNDRDTSNVRI